MASGPNTTPTELLKAAFSVFYHLDREAVERDQKKEKYEDRRQAQLTGSNYSPTANSPSPPRGPLPPTFVTTVGGQDTEGSPGERAVSPLQ